MTESTGHHPNRFINFLYYFYIPLSVIYMPFGIWEHARHYLGWIVAGIWPLMVGVVSALLFIGGRIAKRKGWIPVSAHLWPLFLIFLAGIGVWAWNEWVARSIPVVHWERLGIERIDSAAPDDRPRYEQLRIIIDGTVAPHLMLTPHDLERLNQQRRASKYLADDGSLAGSQYAVFESDEIWKCPRSATVSDSNLNAYVGVYVIRDGQVPNIRLATIDKNVRLPEFPTSGSKFRLVAIVFPFDEAASKVILGHEFELGQVLAAGWDGGQRKLNSKGH